MEKKQKFDIAVIGGGAAGLMAAGQAAKTGKAGTVVLVEAMPRVGKKLLATGNGRCNLTNANAGTAVYHGDGILAEQLLRLTSPEQVLCEFEAMGLYCRQEEQGRIYPQNGQASAVLDALRLFFQTHGGTELCGAAAVRVAREQKGYRLSLADGTVLWARRVILAQGGKASPQISSDQNVPLAHQLGHSQTALFPALAPVTVPPAMVRALKGVRCAGAVCFLADGHAMKSEEGEIQFTERGLSGVCVFQLSRLAAEYAAGGTVQGKPCKSPQIAIDLLPKLSFSQVCDLLSSLAALYPQLAVRELLFGVLPKRVGQQVTASALGEKAGMIAGSLISSQLKALAGVIKSWRFPVTGTLPWSNAQVTAGGVPLNELYLPSMESRICPGVYLAGEQLNVDGDCGGFNLHWAWISGMAAGKSSAMAAKEEKEHD